MWFLDAVASGFQRPSDPGRVQLFRIAFGVVCTLRCARAEQRFALVGPTASPVCTGPRRCSVRAPPSHWRPGSSPNLRCCWCWPGAAMELLYLKSPNSVRYTLLTGSFLLIAGDLGQGLTIEHAPSTANTLL
jgi:hypothetical protein